jgi:WD40 repeat protein
LAVGTQNATLWDVSDIRHPKLSGQFADVVVTSLTYSPNGTALAGLAGNDAALTVWDVKTGRQTVSFDSPVFRDSTDGSQVLAFQPDSTLIADGDQTPAIRLYNLTKHSLLALPAGSGGGVASMAFRPDGTLAYQLTQAKADVIRFAPLGGVAGPADVPLPAANLIGLVRSDGTAYVGVAPDGTIWVTELATAKATKTGHIPFGKDPANDTIIAVSANGRTVGVVVEDDGPHYTLTAWQAATGRRVLSLPGKWDNSGTVTTQIAINPAGTAVAVGSSDGCVALWDIRGH